MLRVLLTLKDPWQARIQEFSSGGVQLSEKKFDKQKKKKKKKKRQKGEGKALQYLFWNSFQDNTFS